MITIAEHTIEETLLRKHSVILDAGCRGMEFTDYFRSMGHKVVAIDIDNFSARPDYYLSALTAKSGRVGVRRNNDPQATTICDGNDVCSVTLQELCKLEDILMFDLIKLDIESTEYEVIMSMDRHYAKQLSVEFHLHTGAYGEREMREMEDKLVSLGYVPVSHEMSRMHGAGLNFWNSLWIWFENKRVK